jgi:hypothetical protein
MQGSDKGAKLKSFGEQKQTTTSKNIYLHVYTYYIYVCVYVYLELGWMIKILKVNLKVKT